MSYITSHNLYRESGGMVPVYIFRIISKITWACGDNNHVAHADIDNSVGVMSFSGLYRIGEVVYELPHRLRRHSFWHISESGLRWTH